LESGSWLPDLSEASFWIPKLRRLLWFFAPFIGWIFAHMSFAIPVIRLRETETLVAFHHPKPAYSFHVLLVPKKSVASLMKLDSKDAVFLSDLYVTVQNLVAEYQLTAYRLIVNGGEYQDFPQLHFHLVSDIVRAQRDN
jgi:histidine triad (HIT) family protein